MATCEMCFPKGVVSIKSQLKNNSFYVHAKTVAHEVVFITCDIIRSVYIEAPKPPLSPS
jgi:hypothetical protein